MAGFGYINENNPVSINEVEAQTMINARIDRGYLEYCEYSVNEECPVPNRIVDLPNGRQVRIRSNTGNWFLGDGNVVWAPKGTDIGSNLWTKPGIAITPELEQDFSRWSLKATPVPVDNTLEMFIPQTAGEYVYCVTIVNNVTHEESAPYFFPVVSITDSEIENGHGIKLTMFPVSHLPNGYEASDYTFRIYRLPFGGSEYMFTFDHSGSISSDPEGESRFDPTPDEYLNEMCDTEKLSSRPFEMPARSITLFDDKLWIGCKDTDNNLNKDFGILYYSRTGEWTAFPATNFFTFPDPVVGIATYDQQLIVLTLKAVYYIYGDPDNYSLKMVDFKLNGIVTNSGQSLGNFAYFLALNNIEDPDKTRGLFMFNGSAIAEISQKINREFPAITTFKNWVLDNRFFIFELKNQDDDTIRIVYDTIAGGYCIVNNTNHSFRYRTKEFCNLPNGSSYLKKICVRAKGTFILYVVVDGKKVLTKHRRTSSRPFDHYLYVKPNRATSFSFVFEGWEGTEIYDWSIAE
ncbi:MAG: hypothetical protein IKP88_14775 [Lachnospiraceae bacterium]|nr:hypothetical protein [Lachnospiraceae bacterium]